MHSAGDHVCMNARMHVDMHAQIHTRVRRTHTYTRVHTRTHAHTQTHIHARTHTHTHKHTHTYRYKKESAHSHLQQLLGVLFTQFFKFTACISSLPFQPPLLPFHFLEAALLSLNGKVKAFQLISPVLTQAVQRDRLQWGEPRTDVGLLLL